MDYTLILHLQPDSQKELIEYLRQNYPNYNIITGESKDKGTISLDKYLPSTEIDSSFVHVEKIFYITDSASGIISCSNIQANSYRDEFENLNKDVNERLYAKFGGKYGLQYPVIAWQHENNKKEDLSKAPWLILSPDALYPEYLEEIYHHHYRIPMKILETKRCLLRELSSDDLDNLIKLQKTLPNPDGGFFPWSKEPCPILASHEKEADFFLKNYIKYQYSFYGYGLYAIEIDGTETSDTIDVLDTPASSDRSVWIGIAGFSSGEVLKECLPISYSILPEYQHRGFAKEVILALTKYANEELEMQGCYARIREDNTASRACIRSCHYIADTQDKTLFWA